MPGVRASVAPASALARVTVSRTAAGPSLLTLLSISPNGSQWSDPVEALIDTGASVTVLYPRSDASAAGVTLTNKNELRMEAVDGEPFRAWGEYVWVRLFEPGQHWECRVPVYFADVPEPLVGLELLMHYFRVQTRGDAWTFSPRAGATRSLRLPIRRSR